MMKRLPRLIGYSLVAALPALLTTVVIYGAFRASLVDFQPYQDTSDSLFYWRQIYTFSEVGFNGGYYSALESSARASFSHFHFHGPIFPMLYGGVGAVVGWYPFSPPIFNMVLLTGALLVFLLLIKPDTRQLMLCAGVLVTSWGVLMYLPSGMAEALNHALSALIIGLLYRFDKSEHMPPPYIRWALFILISVLSLLRITWALLFFAYFFIAYRPRARYRLPRMMISGLFFCGLFYGIAIVYLAAPYPYSQFIPSAADESAGVLSGLIATGSQLLSRLGDNVVYILTFRDASLSAVMLQLIGLTSVLLLLLYRQWQNPGVGWRDVSFHLIGLIIAAPIWILTLALRDFGSDSNYRVLSAHLFMFAMLVAAYNRRWFAVGLVAMAIASSGFFLSLYQWNLSYHLFYDASESELFADEVAPYVRYDGAVSNAWCNTLLFNYWFSYRPALMGLPPGIGANFYTAADDPFEFPLKSRYLLLPPADAGYFQASTDMTYLTTTVIGQLYLNHDADCEMGDLKQH